MKNNKKQITGPILIMTLLIFLITTNTAFAQKNNITVAGSTTILPLSEKWAKAYKSKTGITINVHGGGSTGGIIATKIGTADIGASSRDLNKVEKENLKEIIIGKDALVIIVNKSNPINKINIDDARGIFDGRIKTWREFNGSNKPVQIVNRESGSGTRDLFEEVVMQIMLQDKTRKLVPMSLKSVINNSNAEVKETVKLIPNSIGYISIGYVDDSVKVLKINSIYPTEENIYSGNYKLVRSLYYLVKEEKGVPPIYTEGKVKRFLNFVLSKEGQSLIREEGYLPILVSNN